MGSHASTPADFGDDRASVTTRDAAAARGSARSIGPTWTVVVNWRQADATLACLASLERAGVDPVTVIVVDNGSGDDLVERVRAAYPTATILPQTQNLGFARAVNIGTEYAIARGAGSVFVLNNDAIVLPGAVAML